MNVRTLLNFLIGRREAIVQVANSRQGLWVGLLFVLAAGFAREYDGEDLVHEPWHLFLPLAASLATSLLLYLLVRFTAWTRGASEPSLIAGYRSFLTLYWMTAPLALLYAIPFERFLSGGDAMRANLGLLAIVAIWRVLLITRAISVLYQANFLAALFPVMLFADTVLLAAIAMSPRPVLMMMGGVRLSEQDDVLLGTTLAVGFVGYASWLIWLLGSVVVAVNREPAWRYQSENPSASGRISRTVWGAATVSLGVWLFVLPLTQGEQILRHRVESKMAANQISDALLMMSAQESGDFPPHWDPPPRLGYPRPRPEMLAVQETAVTLPLKPWVRRTFDEKFMDLLRADEWLFDQMPPEEVDRRLRLLDRLANRKQAVEELQHVLRFLLGKRDLPEATRQHIESLLANAELLPAAQQNGEQETRSGSP